MQRADLLRKQLDVKLITSLDRDGMGVDKLEFVMGMLIMMGVEVAGQALTWDSVKPFLVKFDAMDTTKSGRIDKEVQGQRITPPPLRFAHTLCCTPASVCPSTRRWH